jgi:hypothetical protein
MKQVLILAMLTLMGSASFAKNTIICENTGFSGLTVKLTPATNGEIALTVTEAGNGDEFSPDVRQKAILKVDQEGSAGNYLILRSEIKSGSDERAFELKMKKQDAQSGKFPASLGVSREGSDMEFSYFEMKCTR